MRSARSARSSTLQAVVQAALMMTGIWRVATLVFNRLVASSPVIPGNLKSIIIKSGCRAEALSTASGPVLASNTWWPKPFMKRLSDSRNV